MSGSTDQGSIGLKLSVLALLTVAMVLRGGSVSFSRGDTGSLDEGRVIAWGLNNYGQCNVPDEYFVQICAGAYHNLGLRSDGSIVAWGEIRVATPTEGGFTQIAAGHGWSMALRADGSIVAWGSDEVGVVSDAPTYRGFRQISGGCLVTGSVGPRRCNRHLGRRLC